MTLSADDMKIVEESIKPLLECRRYYNDNLGKLSWDERYGVVASLEVIRRLFDANGCCKHNQAA
jgi:hypothetical protein